MQVKRLDPAMVVVGDRLRATHPEKVRQLAFSMTEKTGGQPRGQMTPIEVTGPDEAGRYQLVAGAHRLAAVIEAKLPEVVATIYEGDADPDQLRIREIDENLYRNDLSPYDFAGFLAERAKLFEKLNGKIKQGPKNLSQVEKNSFSIKTAEHLGFSKATIGRARTRFTNIASDVWWKLRGTEAAENGACLDALARLDADKQRAVIAGMRGGQTFQYALGVHTSNLGRAKTPQQEAETLISAFRKASPEARAIFRSLLRKEPKFASSDEG